jgi:hypothetical protein
VPLIFAEGGQILNFILNGQLPQSPSLIFALDLGVVVPSTILAGILLWQRKAWGFVLGAMLLLKSLAYGLVLVVGTSLITASDLAPMDPLMPFYIFVALGGLVGFVYLMKNSSTSQSFTN